MNATAIGAGPVASTLSTTSTTATGAAGATAAAPTAQPSGPQAVSDDMTVLGTELLPAPAGQPQPIHLADGSMLVPIATVDESGRQLPLTANGALAPAPAPAAEATPAPAQALLPAIAGASVGADSAPIADARSAPDLNAAPTGNERGFMYNDNYYKKYKEARPAGTFDFNDSAKLEERVIEATLLKTQDMQIADFGVTRMTMRKADPARDADLFNVNPNAYIIVDLWGKDGSGQEHYLPSVVDRDAGVFVDPRIGRW